MTVSTTRSHITAQTRLFRRRGGGHTACAKFLRTMQACEQTGHSQHTAHLTRSLFCPSCIILHGTCSPLKRTKFESCVRIGSNLTFHTPTPAHRHHKVTFNLIAQ
eukprot:763939-Hanusia_phi.AAC.1